MSAKRNKLKGKKQITRRFFCNVCNAMHTIKLDKSIADNQTQFPFTYIYFHEPSETILTTLFIDKNLNIRGAESIPLSQLETNSEWLNPQKVKKVIKSLAEELYEVRKEYNELNQKFNELHEEHSDLLFDFTLEKKLQNKEEPDSK